MHPQHTWLACTYIPYLLNIYDKNFYVFRGLVRTREIFWQIFEHEYYESL